ncbi:hypothetical protein [Reyranella sp.]|uniref:hypothetical protein n=1 Tax=Reyranella sp. TaxID=1929291 RepID=UPI003BAB62B6
MDAWSPLDAVRAWKGFDRWRGRWPGAGDRPRVFAFGSCRVHDPLAAAHRMGTVDPLARHIRAPWPIFVHDIRETLQLARLLAGEAVLPDDIAPFVFRGGWRPPPRPALLAAAGCVVVEVCTDRHYGAMGHALNINEIHRQIVEPAGEAGTAWWADAHAGHAPAAAVVEAAEQALRRSGRLTPMHERLLREIVLVTLSAAEIADGLAELHRRLAIPILVVPHVAVRLPDGTLLAERVAHIEKVIEAARQAGMPVLNPRSFVGRDGQSRAMGDRGRDFHHYATDYLPVVGSEIVLAIVCALDF